MALSIKDRTGETITIATRRALEERLSRMESHAKRNALLEDMEAMQRRLSALPVLDARSDEDIIGYDDNGIPN